MSNPVERNHNMDQPNKSLMLSENQTRFTPLATSSSNSTEVPDKQKALEADTLLIPSLQIVTFTEKFVRKHSNELTDKEVEENMSSKLEKALKLLIAASLWFEKPETFIKIYEGYVKEIMRHTSRLGETSPLHQEVSRQVRILDPPSIREPDKTPVQTANEVFINSQISVMNLVEKAKENSRYQRKHMETGDNLSQEEENQLYEAIKVLAASGYLLRGAEIFDYLEELRQTLGYHDVIGLRTRSEDKEPHFNGLFGQLHAIGEKLNEREINKEVEIRAGVSRNLAKSNR